MIGTQLSERQYTNAKSVKLLSFKTKVHVVLALLLVIMVFSGCGSADYFLEIGNDYAICRTSPDNRVLGYEPSEDRDFWSTRIENYYISHYFVAGDYIGLCGYYDPSWDAFYVDEMGLHTLPSEDIPLLEMNLNVFYVSIVRILKKISIRKGRGKIRENCNCPLHSKVLLSI